MSVLRSRIRVLTLVWLVCQASALSAFAPIDCCEAHRAHAPAAPECESAADECPMDAVDGTPCPMHTTAHAGETDLCVMRGMCSAPASALATLLPVAGVLTRMPSLSYFEVDAPVIVRATPVPDVDTSTDTPPPRFQTFLR